MTGGRRSSHLRWLADIQSIAVTRFFLLYFQRKKAQIHNHINIRVTFGAEAWRPTQPEPPPQTCMRAFARTHARTHARRRRRHHTARRRHGATVPRNCTTAQQNDGTIVQQSDGTPTQQHHNTQHNSTPTTAQRHSGRLKRNGNKQSSTGGWRLQLPWCPCDIGAQDLKTSKNRRLLQQEPAWFKFTQDRCRLVVVDCGCMTHGSYFKV